MSTSCQVKVFCDRTKDVRKFNCFQILHISWNTKSTLLCAQRRKLSSVTGHLQKKARSPLHNTGSTSRSDRHRVCRVSAMTTSLSSKFTLCHKHISSGHISTSLSMSSSRNESYEKMTFGSFKANSSFNLVTESSVNCETFLPGPHIWVKFPTVIKFASVARVTLHTIVRPCRTVLVNKLHKT